MVDQQVCHVESDYVFCLNVYVRGGRYGRLILTAFVQNVGVVTAIFCARLACRLQTRVDV